MLQHRPPARARPRRSAADTDNSQNGPRWRAVSSLRLCSASQTWRSVLGRRNRSCSAAAVHHEEALAAATANPVRLAYVKHGAGERTASNMARCTSCCAELGSALETDRHAHGEEPRLVGAHEARSKQVEVERAVLGRVAQAGLNTAYPGHTAKSLDHEREIPVDVGLDLSAKEKRIGHVALNEVPAGVQVDPDGAVDGDRHHAQRRREVQVAVAKV